MKIIENDATLFVDVDGTLIVHTADFPNNPTVEVPDPISDWKLKFAIHLPHVRLIREEAARGRCIVVWSRGGYKWATAVVRALGLENSVSYTMTKPYTYIDDVPASNWMYDRINMRANGGYKDERA